MNNAYRVLCAVTAGFDELRKACAPLSGVSLVECGDDDSLVDALPGADGLVIYASRYTSAVARAVQRHAPRWIHVTTSGTDAFEAMPPPPGVTMSSGGRVWSETVAEHAVAMLLALRRQLHSAVRRVEGDGWNRAAAIPALGVVNGSRVLVVGHGAIGDQVASRLLALGAEVTGLARRATRRNGVDVYPVETIDEHLPKHDSVVLCVPRTDQTLGLFDARRLALMAPGSVLVNVSRGGVVNESALVGALAAGRPAMAGIDVYEVEPLPATHPLRSLDNVILTPHVAGFGDDAVLGRVARIVHDNLSDLLAGDAPRDAFDHAHWQRPRDRAR